MMIEWWAGSNSSQLHAREMTGKGRATYAVCSRAVRWTKRVDGAPALVDRCGYCRYQVGIANGKG